MTNFIIGFLLGALIMALISIKWMKPVINTDSYVEDSEQNIKKLKGDGNHLNWFQRRKERRRLRKSE